MRDHVAVFLTLLVAFAADARAVIGSLIMHRAFASVILFYATFIVAPLTALATPITYDLIPAALDNNYNLTGSITTDGTIGTLAVGQIVSWSLDMQETIAPFLNYTANVGPVFISGTITATPSALSIPFLVSPPYPSVATGGRLTVGDLNNDPVYAQISTFSYWASLGVPGWESQILGYSRTQPTGQAANIYSAPPPSPFIFATVPEPSTMVLAYLAAAGLAVMAIRNRERGRKGGHSTFTENQGRFKDQMRHRVGERGG